MVRIVRPIRTSKTIKIIGKETLNNTSKEVGEVKENKVEIKKKKNKTDKKEKK